MLLPRNDIMTQPSEGEGEGHNRLLIFMLKGSFLLADVLYELQLYRGRYPGIFHSFNL